MAQVPINNNSGSGAASSPTPLQAGVSPAASATLSPWEDVLEVPSTPPEKKPTIIGSLDDQTEAAENGQPVPFAVPENIEEKVGQKIPAEAIITSTNFPNKPAQTSPPQTNGLPAKTDKPPAAIPQPVPVGQEHQVPAKESVEPTNPALPVSSTSLKESEKVLGLKPISLATNEEQTKQLANQVVKDQKQAVNQKVSKAVRFPQLGFLKKIPVIAGGALLIFLLGGVYLTERGFLSIGLEKVYGSFGIERIWGGLPKNAERALLVSTLATKQSSNFKIKGSINLTIDKSIKSPVTSPLVTFSNDIPGGDERVAALVRAVKAAALLAQSEYDYYYGTSSGSSTSINDPSVSSDSSTGVSAVESSSSANQSSATQSQENYPSYQYQGTSTKEINSEIAANFGQEGSESEIKVKKVTGTYKINLKNQKEKLWVKSDSAIKFNDKTDPQKWLEYNFNLMKDKEIQKEILSFSPSLGFSLKGVRVGNEKIGGVRSYHYRLDSLEIGRSLEGAGVTSDMIQGITGDVWIGVRDKLIKKVELKITDAPSSPITAINTKIEFYDYGAKNELTVPESAETIIASGGLSNLNANDIQRKSDLAVLQDALEAYKLVSGSYPTSANFVKLSQTGNILERALVSDYLSVLPSDPKSSDGWYYGYKSDGSTYTLSARFENTQDPEVTNIGGIYLHYVYNK